MCDTVGSWIKVWRTCTQGLKITGEVLVLMTLLSVNHTDHYKAASPEKGPCGTKGEMVSTGLMGIRVITCPKF